MESRLLPREHASEIADEGARRPVRELLLDAAQLAEIGA
jgi:hypothetical protein